MKICLIGYGYWGKIIHKNLMSLGYEDVKIINGIKAIGNTIPILPASLSPVIKVKTSSFTF